jgi:hypothetical protein
MHSSNVTTLAIVLVSLLLAGLQFFAVGKIRRVFLIVIALCDLIVFALLTSAYM